MITAHNATHYGLSIMEAQTLYNPTGNGPDWGVGSMFPHDTTDEYTIRFVVQRDGKYDMYVVQGDDSQWGTGNSLTAVHSNIMAAQWVENSSAVNKLYILTDQFGYKRTPPPGLAYRVHKWTSLPLTSHPGGKASNTTSTYQGNLGLATGTATIGDYYMRNIKIWNSAKVPTAAPARGRPRPRKTTPGPTTPGPTTPGPTTPAPTPASPELYRTGILRYVDQNSRYRSPPITGNLISDPNIVGECGSISRLDTPNVASEQACRQQCRTNRKCTFYSYGPMCLHYEGDRCRPVGDYDNMMRTAEMTPCRSGACDCHEWAALGSGRSCVWSAV